MQERTNPELDVATMVMLLDCGMSLKDIAECFKLDVKTAERLIIEHRRSPGSKQSRVVKKLERLELAWLRISDRLSVRMGFSDPEAAPTILVSGS
jgi:hypothetical protein